MIEISIYMPDIEEKVESIIRQKSRRAQVDELMQLYDICATNGWELDACVK